MPCLTCRAIDCTNPDDVRRYSLQSGFFFTNIQYGFVIDCPPGYTCAGGYYPYTFVIDPGTMSVTVPEDIVSDGVLTSPFSASLQCCDTAIPIEAPTGTSLTDLESIIDGAFTQCAQAQAACAALDSPAPGAPAPSLGTNKLAMSLTGSRACLGDGFSARIVSVNATGRVFWQIMAGGLPPGLTLQDQSVSTPNQTHSIGISGTAAIVGNYTFTIKMSDSKGYELMKVLTIAVMGFTNSPSAATVGSPYSFQFTADGGTGPYTFSVPPGHLPAGLSMNDDGLITGTPTEDIATTFTVTIEDSTGAQCEKQFTITPVAGCDAILNALVWGPTYGAATGLWTGAGKNGSFTVSGLGSLLVDIPIHNTTGSAIDILVSTTWSGTGGAGFMAFVVDADFSNICFGADHIGVPSWTETLPPYPNVVGPVPAPAIEILPGATVILTLFIASGDAGNNGSGTVSIACV